MSASVDYGLVAGKFYPCDEGSLGAALAVCVLELNARILCVDLSALDSREAALPLMAQAFEFPDYFGNNLDALYDITGELADAYGEHQTPRVWVIRSPLQQEKLWFSTMDTLRDAMSGARGVGLSIVWLVTK